MDKDQIEKMPSAERVAGFIATSAAVAQAGARLRCKYQGDDFKWTKVENKEWDRATEAYYPYYYSLTPDEWKLVGPLQLSWLSALTRGEWPHPKHRSIGAI